MAIGRRIAALRDARGWSVRELARRSQVSHTQIAALEAGDGGKPQPRTLDALARAFGWPDWVAVVATDALQPPAVGTGAGGSGSGAGGELIAPGDILAPPSGEVGLPIYDGAGAGNPVARDEAEQPLPVARKQLEGEDARMVGPDGFGVRVRGESMSNWDFHERDVLWCNPRVGARLNYPVLALVTLEDGQRGIVVKVLRQDATGRRYLANDGADGNGRLEVAEAELIGPVVLHDPVSRVPRRHVAAASQRPRVDWTQSADEQANGNGDGNGPRLREVV